MTHELRCGPRLHGMVVEDGGELFFETSCPSRWCGKRPEVVVLHRFALSTGELVSTKLFRNPPTQKKEEDGASGQGASVRTA